MVDIIATNLFKLTFWKYISRKNGHTFSYRERHSDNTIGSWHTIQTTDKVRQIVKYGQIVLHDDDELICGEEVTYGLCSL
jgi:hypothetical protein